MAQIKANSKMAGDLLVSENKVQTLKNKTIDGYYTGSEVNTISGSLQTGIDGKADTVHTHTENDITNLDKYTQAEVDSLITTISGKLDDHNELNNLDYASSGHTGFQAAGDYLTDAEFSTYSGTLQTQIDDKSDIGHTHDGRYYTESEVDTISGSLSSEIDADITAHESTYNHPHYDTAYTHSQSAHAPSNADNTAANETSHADVIIDGDFGSDGFLKRSGGAGNYTVDTNSYYTESEVDTISGSLNDKITNENLWDRTGTTLTTHNSGDNVKLDNDVWYSGQNYADSESINIVKVNKNDEINVGAAMSVGPIEGPVNGGAIVGIDMPVTSGTTVSGEMSISYRIDGDNFIKMYSEADGVGGIQNTRVEIPTGIGVRFVGVPVYANNAAAVVGGLSVGDLYRTNGDPDPICIVH